MKVFLVGLTLAGVVLAVSGYCPPEPNVAYGCMYQPKCFGDSQCGDGELCCHRTCGDTCIRSCKVVHCGNTHCQHGFARDSHGCQTCKCSANAPCNSLSCLLHVG